MCIGSVRWKTAQQKIAHEKREQWLREWEAKQKAEACMKDEFKDLNLDDDNWNYQLTQKDNCANQQPGTGLTQFNDLEYSEDTWGWEPTQQDHGNKNQQATKQTERGPETEQVRRQKWDEHWKLIMMEKQLTDLLGKKKEM